MKSIKRLFERLYFLLTIKRFRKAHTLTGQEGLDWISDMIDENIKEGYVEVKDGKIINLK